MARLNTLRLVRCIVLLISLLIITAACSSMTMTSTKASTQSSTEPITSTNQTDTSDPATLTWHYQLQSTDYSRLLEMDVDYLVIDPDDSNLDADRVRALSAGDKTVLAYLSIGEAEDYREYWNEQWSTASPAWLGEENPNWAGNYKVRFWEPAWQQIILERVQSIHSHGYDGLYLDIIDGYEYWQVRGRSTAREDMIRFVEKIRESTDGVLFGQNGLDLLLDPRYVNAIDGVGVEDLWFVENMRADDTAYRLSLLERASRKPVLSIDYPTRMENICTYSSLCSSAGFACLVSDRELSGSPVVCSD